jgi:hypothetical protein
VIIEVIKGATVATAFESLLGRDKDEIIAKCLVLFVAFIPFFAFKELKKVLGAAKVHALFFQTKN